MLKFVIISALVAVGIAESTKGETEVLETKPVKPYRIQRSNDEVDIVHVLTDMISSIMEIQDYRHETANEREKRDLSDNSIDEKTDEKTEEKLKASYISTVMGYVKGIPLVLYETTTVVAPITFQYMLSDERPHPHCELRMMCEVNTRLSARYGRPGELVMQLASTLAGYAIGGDSAIRYDALLEASRMGRRGEDCSNKYAKCLARSDSSPIPTLIRMASRIMSN